MARRRKRAAAAAHRRPARGGRRDRVVAQGWAVWGVVILVGAVLPIAEIFGWTRTEAWSPVASAVHFVEFVVFAALVAAAWHHAVPGSGGYVAATIAGLAYGLATELLQWPIPYRDADPRDYLADVAGVACGLVFMYALRRRRAPRGWKQMGSDPWQPPP